ncbi:hypothetical protein OJAV_G00111750 [Oryzias javanicus]|uniref:Uncharacterized protein n=1 Tax=Oryzias javanicus TaxID=123683 RepID=A0A3S2PHL4_ORYJA|nr:hypothetical protein OJAV_G00111750 [Oryzias javanicus]
MLLTRVGAPQLLSRTAPQSPKFNKGAAAFELRTPAEAAERDAPSSSATTHCKIRLPRGTQNDDLCCKKRRQS